MAFYKTIERESILSVMYLMPYSICLKQATSGVCYLVVFSKWELVYYYFSKWKNDGTIELIHELLRDKVRKNAGKHKSPSLACIDSQSVKTTRIGGEYRGIDRGKKIKGRKRHIITDMMGLLLAVVVHPANVHDSKGASDVIASLKGRFCRLIKNIADGGYRGVLIENTKAAFGWILEVVL